MPHENVDGASDQKRVPPWRSSPLVVMSSTHRTRPLQVYVGAPGLKTEFALDRELLSLGITEGKRHSIVVDTNLEPDTAYRWVLRLVGVYVMGGHGRT